MNEPAQSLDFQVLVHGKFEQGIAGQRGDQKAYAVPDESFIGNPLVTVYISARCLVALPWGERYLSRLTVQNVLHGRCRVQYLEGLAMGKDVSLRRDFRHDQLADPVLRRKCIHEFPDL